MGVEQPNTGRCGGAWHTAATLATAMLLLSIVATVDAEVPGPGQEPGPKGASPIPCKAGYAKKGTGAFKCTLCSGYRFQPDKGQSTCIPCPLPNKPNRANTACVYAPGFEAGPDGAPKFCDPGYAKKGKGIFKCLLCSGDRFQPISGSTSCLTCPANSTVNDEHTRCIAGPGMQPGPAYIPVDCDAGTAKAGSGNFVCLPCDGTGPNGGERYQPDTGATVCLECPIGGSVNEARTTCTPPSPPPPSIPPPPLP